MKHYPTANNDLLFFLTQNTSCAIDTVSKCLVSGQPICHLAALAASSLLQLQAAGNVLSVFEIFKGYSFVLAISSPSAKASLSSVPADSVSTFKLSLSTLLFVFFVHCFEAVLTSNLFTISI